MYKIAIIAWKDIRTRFQGKSELLFFLILPLIFIFLLGGGFTRLSSEPELPRLGVLDADRSGLSNELLRVMQDSAAVNLVRDPAPDALEKAEIDALLEIPAGFERQLLSGIQPVLTFEQPADSVAAEAAEQTLRTAAAAVVRAVSAARLSVAEHARRQAFSDPAAEQAYFELSYQQASQTFNLLPERLEQTVPDQQALLSQLEALAVQGNAGQLLTWVLVPLLATSAVLVNERGLGTLARLLTTPTSKPHFLLGTFTGQLIPAWIQMALLLLFGWLALDISWGASIPGLVVLLFSFSLAAVGMGTLLGTFTRTPGQAGNISIIGGMAMSLLGGCWYPAELFPAALQTANKVLPSSWAMQGLTGLTLQGYGLAQILPHSAVMLAIAALTFALGVWRFRFE